MESNKNNVFSGNLCRDKANETLFSITQNVACHWEDDVMSLKQKTSQNPTPYPTICISAYSYLFLVFSSYACIMHISFYGLIFFSLNVT